MKLLVDSSVWSLALRCYAIANAPQARALRDALEGDEILVTTDLVLPALLRGFVGARMPEPHP